MSYLILHLLPSLLHLLQIIKKANSFPNMFDILEFLIFLYLPKAIQWIFFILIFKKYIENILVLIYHSFYIRY